MSIGHLEAEFRWGLLVVADGQTDTNVLDFASDGAQYVAGPTTVAMRVMNGADGEVVVEIPGVEDEVEASLTAVGSAIITIDSGHPGQPHRPHRRSGTRRLARRSR